MTEKLNRKVRVLKPSLSPATQRFPLSLTPCPGVIHRLQLMNHYTDVTTVTKAHGLHEGSLLVLYPHGFDGRTVTCVIITSHTEEVHCPKSPGGSTFHPSLPLPEAPATTHLFVVSCSWVQTVCSPLDVFFLFPFPQIFTPPPSSQNTHAVPLKQKREVEKNSSLTRLTQSLNMTGHFGGGSLFTAPRLLIRKHTVTLQPPKESQALPPTSLNSLLVFLKPRASCLQCV